ncbi:MAG: SMP-30/gluconolactonase/LRE family protein [Bacteroidota bacterium]
MQAEVFFQYDCVLGEGPHWDHQKQDLLWVDIEQGVLHRLTLREKRQYTTYTFDSRLGAAVPTNQGTYLLALQKGLTFFDPEAEVLEYFAYPERDIPNNRFNDGKCDPAGRFWIGSMDCSAAAEMGNLYRVNKNQLVETMLTQLTISNGLAWNEAGDKMYFIDSATQSVQSFDFDLPSGAITNPQNVILIPEAEGIPDGMTIDAEGMLWIAHWGGHQVTRWNPENGELLQKIAVAAPHVTSCCFGGPQLDQLFITTARIGLSPEQLKQYPLSGSVFSVTPGVSGVAATEYKMK